MNLKTQRNVLALALVVLLVVLGVLLGTGGLTGAAGAGGGIKFDTSTNSWVITSQENQTVNPLNPGQSVVGADAFIPGLHIHKSGGDESGNDIVYVTSNANTGVAFGANATVNGIVVENAANGCSIPGGGVADVGDPAQNYRWNSKKHDYTFSFTNEKTVSKFSIGVLDWGDFLQYQASQAPNEPGVHTIQIFAYNADGEVIDQSEYTFETAPQTAAGAPKYLRPSPQFPNYTPAYVGALEKWGVGMKMAGDACEAELGEPGKLILTVEGTGITRVQVKFANTRSMNPHIALWLGALEIEFEGGETPYFIIMDEETIKADSELKTGSDKGTKIIEWLAGQCGDSAPNLANESGANDGVRTLLEFSEAGSCYIGKTIQIPTGQPGDEGFFALTELPDGPPPSNSPTWNGSLESFWNGSINKSLLDKVPNVIPLRTEGLNNLVGYTFCAILYKSDVSINYSPINGNLQGATRGVLAFEVVGIDNPEEKDRLPDLTVTFVDASICGADAELFTDVPLPQSSSVPNACETGSGAAPGCKE